MASRKRPSEDISVLAEFSNTKKKAIKSLSSVLSANGDDVVMAKILALDAPVREVYEYAYMIQGTSPSSLLPDDDHCKFVRLVRHKDEKFIFLTGIPGSGKSTVLKLVYTFMCYRMARLLTPEKVLGISDMAGLPRSSKISSLSAAKLVIICTTPTGPATFSLNNAVTFDSLFAPIDLAKCGHMTSYNSVPDVVIKRLLPISVLIVDEISMIHPLKFESACRIFSLVKKNNELFGGIKLIISGDFHQLKPVFDPHDDVSLAMRLLPADAVSKKQFPLVFDTKPWLQNLSKLSFVKLSRSFRQKQSAVDFMDLLSHVREDNLLDRHKQTFTSRIMTYEEFVTASPNREVTPVFSSRQDVASFNESALASLNGTKHVYFAAMICSSRPASELTSLLNLPNNDPGYLSAGIIMPSSDQAQKYKNFGLALTDNFTCRANPVDRYVTNGVCDGSDDRISEFSGFYFERTAVVAPEVLKMAQREKSAFGRGNFVTALKIGAKVSFTKNLSISNGITNGSTGTVVAFMSIQCFMSAQDSKRDGFNYISRKEDPRLTATDLDPELEWIFDRSWGLVCPKAKTTKNESRERFPLVQMHAPSKVRFILVTPVLRPITVSSEYRQKQNQKTVKNYMARSIATNTAGSGNSATLSSLSASEHLDVLSTARKNISRDYNADGRHSAIYGLQLPLTLAWATTAHSIQGLSLSAVWLGDCGLNMQEGMFYVILSRVSKLKHIAWSKDPTPYVRSNPRVTEFYNTLAALEATTKSLLPP